MQVAIDAQETSYLWIIDADVQRFGLFDRFELLTCQSFLLQKIFGPGWIHHFDAIGIRPSEVFV